MAAARLGEPRDSMYAQATTATTPSIVKSSVVLNASVRSRSVVAAEA
jgi:hypothetical protein